MKYKIVLFDADGVTLNEGPLFSEVLAEKRMITSLEKTTSFFNGVFKKCLVGQADLKEELAHVIGGWGWKGTVDELIDFWFTVGNEINQDVATSIRNIKTEGVSCYLATNQEKYRGEFLKKVLAGLFDHAYVSAEIGYTKDDPRFFEYIYDQEKTKVNSKQEIILIDDDEKNILAARQCGIEAVHYRTSADLMQLWF